MTTATVTSISAAADVAETVAEVLRLRDEVQRLRDANDNLAGERARSGLENVMVRAERDRYIEALRRISQWRETDPFAPDPADLAREALQRPVMA